jgi:hypothetical protein
MFRPWILLHSAPRLSFSSLPLEIPYLNQRIQWYLRQSNIVLIGPAQNDSKSSMTSCPTSTNSTMLPRSYTIQQPYSITYDHRRMRTGHPVRSGVLKHSTGCVVVGWVTTSEFQLLYVVISFCHFFSCFPPGCTNRIAQCCCVTAIYALEVHIYVFEQAGCRTVIETKFRRTLRRMRWRLSSKSTLCTSSDGIALQ